MKNVMIFLVIFIVVKNVQSQNNFDVALSTSIIRFSDNSARIIGDKHVFLAPVFDLTYNINKQFSLNAEVGFTTINDIGIMRNSISYNSFGLSGRYHLGYFNKFKPYVFVGGSFVKAEAKRTPTLNFGIGNSYWLSESLGINTQIMYKFSENRFESMQSHFQFKLGVVYNFDIGHLFRRKSVCKTNGF